MSVANYCGKRIFVFVCLFGLIAGSNIGLAQSDDRTSFIQRMIDAAQPKMVKVYGAGAGRVEGFATGILVSDDGKILTSQGVFLDGKQVKIVLADGSNYQATILKRNRESQLALLKIQAETPDYFELSTSTLR